MKFRGPLPPNYTNTVNSTHSYTTLDVLSIGQDVSVG